jgi:tetratricopeptide (TPR) repeat protein
VNTGEVVTGTAERLVTGDAVNVAARFEQTATPGEVLIGASTHELVHGAVDAEPVEPLVLKGKAEPVAAFRLLAAHAAAERRHDSLFVGRERELGLLADAWERAVAEQRCELVTVVGDPGIGKSRLAAEALASFGVPVVRGRCLPYGAGITYWPVVEVIKQLDVLPAEPAAAAAIRSLLGESDAGTSAEEIGWAFRKLLEEQAPLVVAFDDIQWGEETFLDLIEHVALLSAAAPLLLLCMARPELLDSRPTWPVAMRLEPLGDADTESLIGPTVSDDLRSRIAAAAAGNPLFISEMLAMSHQAGDDVEVPSSLKALLGARLDQLDPAERRVLECGSVEGEVFHRGAVQALTPEETQVTPRLAALVRRELIRSDRPRFASEDGFRFRHLLIRDAAYDALPKTARAEMHQRFATWLDEHGQQLVERDEIVGYHLEQAARYLAELGRPEPALTEQAAARLVAAGRRAEWRGDDPAAAGLLERALTLTRPLRLDVQLELDLSNMIRWRGGSTASAAIAAAAAERARAAGDEAGELLARTWASYVALHSGSSSADELERLAQRALPLLEARADHAGLTYIWGALGGVASWRGQFEDYARAAEHALHHSQLAGIRKTHFYGLPAALTLGPRPAGEALQTLDDLVPGQLSLPPAFNDHRAWLLAMLDRLDEASQTARAAAERRSELGLPPGALQPEVTLLAGDDERAVLQLQEFCDYLDANGWHGNLSGYGPMLGRVLCRLGRHGEAEPLAQQGRALADPSDIWALTIWRQVQALVEASRGNHAEAERLAREAVEIIARSDALNLQGDALTDLAQVLAAAERHDEAAAAYRAAFERYERKQNIPLARRTRERLAALQAPTA